MRVTATQKGYYGNVVREPGDVFRLADEDHFSATWMAADEPHPLDHDGDGHKGGSKPRKGQVRETEVIQPTEPATASDLVTGGEI